MDFITTTEITKHTDKDLEDPLKGKIIGAAIDIHWALGPGLLESAYEPSHEAQVLSYLKLSG